MKTRGTEREKPDIGQPFHPTPALGSPLQTNPSFSEGFGLVPDVLCRDLNPGGLEGKLTALNGSYFNER